MIFLLIDLMLACIAGFFRSVEKHYKIINNILDQYNNKLKQNYEITENIRKCFAFQKIKGSIYTILYFKSIGAENEVKNIRQDLINFGVDKEIAEDDIKLSLFLKEFGEGKYQLIVDSKKKKFSFRKKETENQ